MPLPAPGSISAGKFPSIQRATLSNGLKVMLVERHQAPLVSVEFLADTAYGADYAQTKAGTGGLAVSLMDEGTTTRDSLTLADQLVRIGASVGAGGGGEQSTVSLSALTPTLDQALTIFADVIRNPAYRQADVDRVKAQQAAAIRAQRLQPATIANRVLSGSHLRAEPSARTTDDGSIGDVHHARRPRRVPPTVVQARQRRPARRRRHDAGADHAEARGGARQLESVGAQRRASRCRRRRPRTAPAIYLVDRPGSPQSYILAGLPAAPRTIDEEFNIWAFNTNFGGNFTSRINMNLREDKGWSYGVSSAVAGGRGPRMFRITAQVQTDKTKESIQELQKETARRAVLAPAHARRADDVEEQHDHGPVEPVGVVWSGRVRDG